MAYSIAFSRMQLLIQLFLLPDILCFSPLLCNLVLFLDNISCLSLIIILRFLENYPFLPLIIASGEALFILAYVIPVWSELYGPIQGQFSVSLVYGHFLN